MRAICPSATAKRRAENVFAFLEGALLIAKVEQRPEEVSANCGGDRRGRSDVGLPSSSDIGLNPRKPRQRSYRASESHAAIAQSTTDIKDAREAPSFAWIEMPWMTVA
jgi:hypothetical protein